jgi:pyruvate formate lyase activating enzyme
MVDNLLDIKEIRGIVFNIQRYSLHDGPGLRTNIFFKGCTLDCLWCSNPEGKSPNPQISFFEPNCFLCGDCVTECPESAIALDEGHIIWNRLMCKQSGRCAQVCTAHAFTSIGKEMTAGAVVDEVLRDAAFYGGHGGLTLSGGEPTLQPEFAEAILRLSIQEGLHTAIETCGAIRWENLQRLLPFLSQVLFDLKHINPVLHKQFTGWSNEIILENLQRTAQSGANLIVRVPLIPGFNANPESLSAIGHYVQTLQVVREFHVIPYHTLGRSKYRALGLPYPMEDYPPMQLEEAEQLGSVLRDQGFTVLVGG